MNILLQTLTAFFAVVGLFETAWQIILFFTRRATKGQQARIIIKTNEHTDPAFLAEDLNLLTNRLAACDDLRIWLICPNGAKQERICRYVAERNETVRVISPEKLPDEISAFSKDL